jgi:chaperonin GroEL
MSKTILYGDDARQAILKGVDALTNAVAATLGPAGRNAIIFNKFDTPLSTRDGVTVAKNISFDDLAMDAGAQLVKQAASETADQAGDGTTTSTILARAIYREGLKAITAKSNSVAIKRGIDRAVDFICRKGGELDKVSKPVVGDAIVQVATISANNDAFMGELIARAIRLAGKDGVITVEESKTLETTLETVEGMKLNTGFISPYFITNQDRQEAVLEDCYVLCCEQRLGSMGTVLDLFGQLAKSGKSLFVIAEDVEGEVLPLLVVNNVQGRLQSCAVKAPGIGSFRKELLNDIAALTGGRAILQDLGDKPENIKISDLGRAKKVIVSKSGTTIIAGENNKMAVASRIKGIRTQLSLEQGEYEKDRLQERLAKLTGGVSIIKVGAASEVEMSEKKARIEDALFATRCAVEEGVVPGGGVTLARLIQFFYGSGVESEGMNILMAAMQEPLRVIASNAGQDDQQVLDTVLSCPNFDCGYNALTDTYEDLVKAGVLDPTKVVRTALQNAASVAGILLLTESLIIESLEAPPKPRLPGRR